MIGRKRFKVQFERTNRRLAFLGVMGGPVLFAAEMLSVLFKEFSLSDDGLLSWGTLSPWRIAASAVLGVIGTLLLLCGLWSGYRVVREHCHHIKRSLYLFGIAGRSVGSLCHFLIFCFIPLAVRFCLASDVSRESALARAKAGVLSLRLPILLCLGLLLFSVIFITIGLLHEDVHVSRNLAVLNTATLGVLGTALFLVIDGISWRGAFLGLFSLGDTLQAFAIYLYWRKKEREAEEEY